MMFHKKQDLYVLNKEIKSQITRNINKQIPSYVTKFVDNGKRRNNIVKLWFKCIINLNDINNIL